ncbi:hypothetical protein BASA60_009549 [Batrachochytrium salamandrivorans]|nr:hypothetical protein BASA60_009549 [Batrachochytrium salamandrivorans]
MRTREKDSLVYIFKLQLEHSLDCPEVRNISTSAMRLQATEVLSTIPYVRPSSLVNLARLKHGATSLYSSAWRALQCHRQDISKADVISFGQIPYFLHEIEIANSGSTTYVAATSEERQYDIQIQVWVVRSGRQQRPAAKSNTMKRWQLVAAINCYAAEYLENLDPKRRARSHFPVPRFGTVTLNSAESLNSWMEEYRDKSHLVILACCVSHPARLLYSRKQEYANADTVLSPRSFRTFNQNRDNGRRHQMFQTSDHLFKVTSLTSGYTHMQIVSVNLDTIDCDEALQSPNVVKKAGRPRKVRLQSRGEVDDNDRYACKECGLLGHNARTCSRRQPPSVLPVDLEEGNQEPFQQQLDIGNLNGGSGPKRTRVYNVVCINCGGNHYRKTPCRVPIH